MSSTKCHKGRAFGSRDQTQESWLALAFGWSRAWAASQSSEGIPALRAVYKREPLLQKETSIDGGSNYIPSGMMLDPPNH